MLNERNQKRTVCSTCIIFRQNKLICKGRKQISSYLGAGKGQGGAKRPFVPKGGAQRDCGGLPWWSTG